MSNSGKFWIFHDGYDCPCSCTYWYDVRELADASGFSEYCLSLMTCGDSFECDEWLGNSISCHEIN